MSNIRQRGDKWQVRVTVAGETVTKTFSRKADAEKWSRHQQVLMERGEHQKSPSSTLTLAQAVERYEREVLPGKRGKAQEKYLLAYWRKSQLGAVPLARVKAADIAQQRDNLLQRLSTGSVRRYLDTLGSVFTVACREWQIVNESPLSSIRKPPNGRARERRLAHGELERVIAAGSESPDLGVIVMLAVESGMRRAEMLGLEWRYVDLARRLVHLPLTKNGESRTVPLSTKAADLLAKLPRRIDGKVFAKNGTSLSSAFTRAVSRARKIYERERLTAGASASEVEQDPYLVNLRLHDCRHEAISRLVEGGFNLIEAAAISGHRTLACLKRYSHVRPAHLIAKLDAIGA